MVQKLTHFLAIFWPIFGPKIDPFFGHFLTHFLAHFWTTFLPSLGPPYITFGEIGGPKMGSKMDPFLDPFFDPFFDQKLVNFWQIWHVKFDILTSKFHFLGGPARSETPREPLFGPLFGPFFGVLSRKPLYSALNMEGNGIDGPKRGPKSDQNRSFSGVWVKFWTPLILGHPILSI